MRIAYLDCFSGISGDMFMGALLDAGVPPKLLKDTVAGLHIGATLEISRVNRGGIQATKVAVLVNGRKDSPRVAPGNPSETAHDRSSHKDSHSRDHSHALKASPQAAERRHHHGRGLNEIKEIIRASKLAESTKRTAIAIFEKLGVVESKIHNVPIEQIHFHEVGAVDAMVDIVCAAVGAEALEVDEFVCSPLNLGGGTVECAHGTFPVPAPATLELLRGAPVYSSGIQAELVTPTGAAIVATLVSRFDAFPAMNIEKTGSGAGSRDLPGHGNVLRLTVGETLAGVADESVEPARSDRPKAGSRTGATQAALETISVLEANLDDLNPQVFGYVMDRLLEAGALDVFGTPVQMKKNRPGTLLTILCRPEDADKLTQIVFTETTTLGVRRRKETREVLDRKWQTVRTQFGDVRIKIASMNGTVTGYAPEYEDCRRIAAEQRVPLKMVMQEAVQEYLKSAK